ncbi:DMT family transporter [Candidatus Nesciobacter abundans]|uniref:DMT family transporter n=1 Tax=Candidatus Nesciobacter abundans TaxID=2601668 RepID=A0A5C0UHP7_9PROT|nr:DMT family transporter [Candidatus Nesciobacter abundans]QEK39257.1 DMT family transporter [Candidatus Nesciobacter abundans]
MYEKIKSRIKLLSYPLMSVVASSLLFSIMKTISRDKIPTEQFMLIRLLISSLFFIPMFLKVKSIKTKINKLHFLRAIVLFSSMIMTYEGYRNIPFVTSSALGMTEPIFIFIFSWAFFRNKISYQKVLGILFGYIGVLVTLYPFDLSINTFYSVILLLANVLSAISMILMKKSHNKDAPEVVLFYSYFYLTMFSIIWNLHGLFFRDDFILMDFVYLYENIWRVVSVCSLAAVNTYAIIWSIKKLDPISYSSVQYLKVVFSVIIGWVFLGESLVLNQILGSLIIAISASIMY